MSNKVNSNIFRESLAFNQYHKQSSFKDLIVAQNFILTQKQQEEENEEDEFQIKYLNIKKNQWENIIIESKKYHNIFH